MKKTHLSLAVVGALSLAACSSGSNASDGDSREITLGLAGNPPIVVSTVLHIAETEGYFEDEGLDVTLRSFTTGTDVVRAVQSGEIQGGMTVTNAAASVRASGGSIVGVMGYPDSSFTLISTNSEVDSCEDVVNGTVAVDVPGTPLYVALEQMLASCGVSIDELNSITVNGVATIDAVLNKQVDVAVVHPEQMAMAAQRMETTRITSVPEVNPLSHYMMLVTTDQELEDEETRDQWVRIVRASAKAIDYMYAPENLEAVVAASSEITTRDHEVMADAMPAYLDMDFWPNGHDGLQEDRVTATIAVQVEQGNIPEGSAPAFDEIADPSIYADAVSE